MRDLVIDNFRINDDSDCYVIAEIGHNHQGELARCKELFQAAKECGAHAVKLQKRDNRTLFTKEMYDKPYDNENSYGATYGEHREFLEFGEAEYKELIAYCKEIGITFFSTAFDIPSADFLHALDMPAYKMASGDLTNTPLLEHVAKFGKPMILSTGGGTIEDVQRAYDLITGYGTPLVILQCTAGYPCKFEEMNLRVISTYRELFPKAVIGLSSHDSGIAMASAAFVLGSRVVEKHFTLNRAWRGTDHAFSLERPGLSKMVRDLERVRAAMGDGVKRTYPSEVAPIYKMSKKLVAARDLEAGTLLTEADIAARSPGDPDALRPFELSKLIGKKLITPLKADQALSWGSVGV